MRAVFTGALWGAAVGVALLLIGVIRALVVVVSGGHVSFADFLGPAAIYVGGFGLGGAVLALALPLARRRLGRYTIGVVSMTPVVGVINSLEAGLPWHWKQSDVMIWVGLSLFFGAALGYGMDREAARQARLYRTPDVR